MNEFNQSSTEIRTFLEKLTDNRCWDFNDLSECWEIAPSFQNELIILVNKWKGLSKQKKVLPINRMQKDLNKLALKYSCDKEKDEDVIEWGIRLAGQLLDRVRCELPYLRDTDFDNYIMEISKLLREISLKKQHGEILKLVGEVREHSDMVVIGQFCSNEMVDYYKYLILNRQPNSRKEIVKYLEIYSKLCGIYVKDMIFTYCLLRLKEKGSRPAYAEIRNKIRAQQNIISYIRRQIKLFGKSYDTVVRNAEAHTDVETDSNKQMVYFHVIKNKPPKELSYGNITSLVRELSAIVLAFRLFMVILSKNDWEDFRAIINRSVPQKNVHNYNTV